jgi:hypothetical protein
MIYRVRTAEKKYGEGDPKVIPAVCDLGDWFSEVGMAPEARLTFQMALNIAGDKESLNAPIIVEPLRGIARTYMRRASYPENWLRPLSPRAKCGSGLFGVSSAAAPTSNPGISARTASARCNGHCGSWRQIRARRCRR